MGEIISGSKVYDSVSVSAGQEYVKTDIFSSGSLHVSSGGTANKTNVYNLGVLRVSSGGIANSTSIRTSGFVDVCSSGILNSTTVSGILGVYSSGTANDTAIYYNGSMSVYSGGTANNVKVNSDGCLIVANGGIANDIWVVSSARLIVSSGGTANNILRNEGRLQIESGGTATLAYNPWSIIKAKDYPTYATVIELERDANIYYGNSKMSLISKADVMDSLKLESGLSVIVYSKGIVNDMAINSGYLNISNGGMANGTTINGGQMNMYEGGVANNTAINGGQMNMCGGGEANDTTIYRSGFLLLSYGGVANNTTIENGRMNVVAGSASNTTINSGFVNVIYGGTADSVMVNSGGRLYVSSGGTAVKVKENGGYVSAEDGENVSFAKNEISDLVLSSADATIHSGTTANNVNVNSGGQLYIFSGGTATNIVWTPGVGHVSVESGAHATFTSRYSGVYHGSGEQLLSHAQTITSAKVNASMYVMSGGLANTAEIYSSGIIFVYSGGTANKVSIHDSGRLFVSSGGTANNTVIYNQGSMFVSSGGKINNTYLYGFLHLSSGVIANDTVIDNWGIMYVSGGCKANRTEISCGDLIVLSDGVINNTTVNYLCTLNIFSEGMANDTTVKNGGFLSLYGGTVNSVTVNSGGSLSISGGTLTGQINFNSKANVSALTGAVLDFNVTKIAPGTAALVNDLSVIHGTLSYVITVGGSQSSGTYKLADGASLFDGSITVKDSAGTVHGKPLSLDGTSAEINGMKLMLNLSGSILSLLIDTKAPTVANVKASSTTPTNGNVTLTADFSDDAMLKSMLYKYGNDEEAKWKTYEDGVIVSDNMTVYFKAIDAVGNESEIVSYTVNNIDRTPPKKPEAAANVTALTTEDVLVSATFSGDTVVKEYSLDGREWLTYENPVKFTTNGVVYFRGIDVAGNISEATEFQVANIYPRKPVASADITTPTNSNVLVSAVFNDKTVVKEYSLDGREWYTYANPVKFTTNGVVYFRGTDNAGSISEVTEYHVTNIDKIPPEKPTTSSNVTSPTTGDVLVSATFSGDSVVKEYSLDGRKWHPYENPVKFTMNGIVYFHGIDEAGNVSEATECQVTNIYPGKPVASADVTALTNGNVRVSASFNDSSTIREYSFDGRTWKSYTGPVTFTANGVIFFRGADEAGNVSEVTEYHVTNIDKTPPEKPVASADVADQTTGDVHVSATFSNDSVLKEYSLDGKEWHPYENPILFTSNGVVYFRGTDEAGNISETTSWQVGNIIPGRPVATADVTDPTNGDVYVSATFSESSVVKEYSLDNKTWKTYSGAIKFTSNGAVYFRGKDSAGKISDVTVFQVENIDKTAPAKPTAYADVVTTTKGDVLVYAVFSNDTDIREYSLDGEKWVFYTEPVRFTSNGIVFFRGRDLAGNISAMTEYRVANIEKAIPAKPAASANITEPTYGEVLVKAVFSSDSAVKEYSIDGRNWKPYTEPIKFTSNGTVFFRGSNSAGKTSEITIYQVSNIETAIPDILTGEADNGWNDWLYEKKIRNPQVTGLTALVLQEGITEVLLDEVNTVSRNGKKNFVGFGGAADGEMKIDAADYTKIHLDCGTSLRFNLSATDAAKFVIYSLTPKKDKNGNIVSYTKKTLQTTTLTRPKKSTGDYMAESKALLLQSGDYYISMQSSNAKKGGSAFYDVKVSDLSKFYSDGDAGTNNWLYDKNLKVLNPDEKQFCSITLTNAINNIQLDLDELSFEDSFKNTYSNYVGFGDDTDIGMFKLDCNSARVSFNVQATNAAKIVIYQLKVKWKKSQPVYTLKALQTTKLKKINPDLYSVSTKALKLASGNYYIAVQSTNAKKGGGTYYNVSLNTKQSFFSESNGDRLDLSPAEPADAASGMDGNNAMKGFGDHYSAAAGPSLSDEVLEAGITAITGPASVWTALAGMEISRIPSGANDDPADSLCVGIDPPGRQKTSEDNRISMNILAGQ